MRKKLFVAALLFGLAAIVPAGDEDAVRQAVERILDILDMEVPLPVPAAPSTAGTYTASPPPGALPESDRELTLTLIPMVRIPGGTFAMGSPAGEGGRRADEGPQRQVTVSAFYMGRHEVTQGQFLAVMGGNPSHFTWDRVMDVITNFPVENVSWYDAIAFSNRLSILAGLRPAYEMLDTNGTGWTTDPDQWGPVPTANDTRWNAVRMVAGSNGYRLPTEAQWEFAARAGTVTPWNTGQNITQDQANFNVSGSSQNRNGTIPVGSFTPNAWGLYDMHGNVWEWVWDRYGTYPNTAGTNPTGASSGSLRVLRGGSWSHSAGIVRSASRGGGFPSSRGDNLGFRVARP